MAKNKYAQLLYGKVLYIFETDLKFNELSTIFDPTTYWVDVTGMECEVGYIASFKEGVGLVLTPPPDITHTENEALAAEAKAKLQKVSLSAMMMELAGSPTTSQAEEYKTVIKGVSDDVALLIPEVYPVWSADSVEYKKDDRVTYDGILYKVLTDHTSQASWTPTDAPSLFVKVLTSENEILDWEQPSADNAYMKGDKVKYNGKVYESLIDNNVWAPDAYPQGWKEVE
jgi:hypothetical protein